MRTQPPPFGLAVLRFVSTLSASLAFALALQPTGGWAVTVPMRTDNAIGGWTNGSSSFVVGTTGTDMGTSAWPSAESPAKLVDGDTSSGSKFLFFRDGYAGVIVSPQSGTSAPPVNRLVAWSANDAEGRDPVSFSIYGSTSTLSNSTPGFSYSGLGTSYPLIANGTFALPSARNAAAPVVTFLNGTAYASYILVFNTTKTDDPGGQDSGRTQIAEVEFQSEISSNANLSGIALSTGTLSPTFNGVTTTSYGVTVSNATTSISVTPTLAHAGATMLIGSNGGGYSPLGSGSSSGPISLNVGSNNTITLRTTAEDTTTIRYYYIYVTRADSAAGEVETYNANLNNSVTGSVVQPDGKTILCGDFTSVLGVTRQYIARLNADGSLDTGFNPTANSPVRAMTVQADGKILIGGEFLTLQPNGAGAATSRQYMARLNADGSLDTSFDPKPNGTVLGIAVQLDGKILAVGSFWSLQPNGAFSATTRRHLARLNQDGTLDTGFNPNPDSHVRSVAIQPDGKLLLGGDFTTLQPNGAGAATTRRYLARVNADGTLDTGFHPNPNGSVNCLCLQPDGKVVIGGSFSTVQPASAPFATSRTNIARVNSDGTLDMDFDPKANGGQLFSAALQTDGKVLLCGTFNQLQPNGSSTGVNRNCIARVYATGTLDSNFDPNANYYVLSLALRADGKVQLGGPFGAFSPYGGSSVGRSYYALVTNDTATQSLTVPSSSRVQWLRGGASPEALSVSFELSTNGGSTYAPLGNGVRISGGWELTGIILPASGQIRARARTSGGQQNGSSGLVETVTSYSGLTTGEITVTGNAVSIADGDTTPAAADHTDFGPVNLIGGTLTRTFTISNSGTVPLGIGNVIVSGANAADFTITQQPAASVAASGGSTTFQVTFDPSASGLRSATLTFANTDSNEDPFDFSLQGSGQILPPVVTAVAPAGGPIAGGTAVTITGANFTGASAVTFAGVSASGITVVNDTTITCTTPSRSAGTASVVVTTVNGFNADNSLFTYHAPPTVTAVTPASGGSLGGTSVTISGTNLSGATAVRIGDIAVSSFTVVNDTTITCATPPRAVGSASVVVTTPGGVNAANALYTYVYIPPPTVLAVSPNSGSVAGNAVVTITGTNFTNATEVRFGTTPALNLNVVSATTITCTTPASAAGVVGIVVTAPGGQNATNSLFTYVQPNSAPSFDVLPNYSYAAIFAGSRPRYQDGFAHNISVGPPSESGQTLRFILTNDNPGLFLAQPTIESYGTLNFTPNALAGTATVTVVAVDDGGTAFGGVNTSASKTFTISLLRLPVISSVTPDIGSTVGGTVVTIRGRYLTGATSVPFSGVPGDPQGTPSNFTVVNDTTITCITPPKAYPGMGKVTVVTPGGEADHNYRYTFPNVAPRFDLAEKGTWVGRMKDRARNWRSIASSADGRRLFAVAGAAYHSHYPSHKSKIYNSVDGGATWTPRGDEREWLAITASADGQKLTAMAYVDYVWVAPGNYAPVSPSIYTSTNGGVNWTVQPQLQYSGAPNQSNSAMAASADGSKLVALDDTGYRDRIHTSTDSGVTWTKQTLSWFGIDYLAVTSSADGGTLAVAGGRLPNHTDPRPGRIGVSNDSGVTWTERGLSRDWTCITSSVNGSKMAAAEGRGGIHTSTDSGVTWVERTSLPIRARSIAWSADGSKLAVAGKANLVADGTNRIYTSADSGVTWTFKTIEHDWGTHISSITSSADGDRLAAASYDGNIFTNAQDVELFYAAGSGPQSKPGFAVNIVVGPPSDFIASEDWQKLTFEVTTNNPGLFAVQPSIDSNGTLTFTPGNAAGTATVTVRALDDGGTENGGVDASAPQTFTITLWPAPIITSFSPTSGGGGTNVTITGTNFIDARTVKFGNTEVTNFTLVDNNTITCTLPAGALGAANVIVTAAGGTATATTPFNYVGAPTVTASTSAIPTTTKSLTIKGSRFSAVAGENTVIFTPAITGTITAATATTLTVTGISGLVVGPLKAVVITNGQSTRTPVQVATVTIPPDGDLELPDLVIAGGHVNATAVQPDGKLILVGNFTSVLGTARNRIARLNANGTLDMTFNPNADGEILCVAVQPDGKVLIGGAFTSVGGMTRNRVARVDAAGTVDAAFDPNANGEVRCLAVLGDGKVLIGGIFSTVNGSTNRSNLARVDATTGTADSFAAEPDGVVATLAVQQDGKILLGGNFTTVGGTARNRIARVGADGVLDTTFNPDANGGVSCLTVQADGKVLLGGAFTALQPNGAATATVRNRIARLNAIGTLDANFNPNANGNVRSIVVQADGMILLGGNFTTIGATARNRIARLTAAGAINTVFATHVNDGEVRSVALQADGRVLLGGSFTQVQATGATASAVATGFARLYNKEATQKLTAPTASQIVWTRGGGGPELSSATFDLSTDGGLTWTPLGTATRSGTTSNWQLGGLSLPLTGRLRAFGVTGTGFGNGSSGLISYVTAIERGAEMDVLGNGAEIADGDTSPTAEDHTDFGSVPTAIGAAVRTFIISNSGPLALALTGTPKVALSGSTAFAVTTQPASSVAANTGVTTFKVTFDPSNAGLQVATVTIASNDPDENPYTFDIQGTGSAPEIDITGNSEAIANGASSPNIADDTEFGVARVGDVPVEHTFTLANTGVGNLNLTAASPKYVTFTTATSDFSVIEQPTTPVAEGADTTFKISFSPGSIGVKTATVKVTSDDTDEASYTFTIRGTGAAPKITVKGNNTIIPKGDTTPATTDHTDFGLVNHNNGSLVRTFTISNTGGWPLDVEASVTGSTDFAITTVPSSPVAALTGTTTFQITFDPSSEGDKTATVRIVNGDADANPYTFAIKGTGAAPEIAVKGNNQNIAAGSNTPSLADHTDFGVVRIGTSFLRTFTVANSGTLPLNLTGTPNRVNIYGSSEFSVSLQPTSPVATGGSATIKVSFSPLSAGVKTATVSLTSDDADESPFSFIIQGTAGQPEIAVSGLGTEIDNGNTVPGALDGTDFGSVPVLNATRVRTFTIANIGLSDLLLPGTAKVTLTGSTDFTVSAQPTSPVAATSGVTTFKVTFNPSSDGSKTATVRIANDDLDESPYIFAIQGTGSVPEISVSGNGQAINSGDITPSSDDHTEFGAVAVNSSSLVRTFTIANSGPGALNLTGTPSLVTLTGSADFTVSAQPYSPVGFFTTFDVTFNPSSMTLQKAKVTIKNDDADESTYTFDIQGTGAAPEIAVTGNSVEIPSGHTTPATADHTDFGTLSATTTSVVRTFTISNTGTMPLSLSGTPRVTLSNDADFTVTTQPASSSVAASGSTTFDITFDAISGGARTSTVSIANDDPNESPYTFTIKGISPGPEITVEHPAGTGLANGSATIAFPGQALGSTSTPKVFTVKNTGTSKLKLGNITLTGTNSAAFTIAPPTNLELGAGQSTTFSVAFTPEANGPHSAVLHLVNSDENENPFTVTLTGFDISPSLTAIANQTTTEDTSTTIALAVRDADSLPFNLRLSAISGNPDLVAEQGIVFGGSIDNPTITLTPSSNQHGTASILVIVTDELGNSTSRRFDLTVTPVADPPVALDQTDIGTIGDRLRLPLHASDPDGDALTYTKQSEPTSGTVTLDSDGFYNYMPNAGFQGNDSFTYVANDGTSNSAVATVSIRYHTQSPHWAWMGGTDKTNQLGVYGTKGTAASANFPGSRSDSAVWSDGDGLMWVFGGSGRALSTTAGSLNDLWRVDLGTGLWTWLGGSNAINAGGVYGTAGTAASANIPGARSGAATWRDSSGNLWLFGGTGRDASASASGLLNDLWKYDVVTGLWTWIKGSSTIKANGVYGTAGIPGASNTPGARSDAAAWLGMDGSLWLFGGNGLPASGTTAGQLNDLWRFDTGTGLWTWVRGSNSIGSTGVYGEQGIGGTDAQPGGRSDASAWVDAEGSLWLFGGNGRAVGTTVGLLNDLWKYEPSSNTWIWVRGAAATGAGGSYGDLGVASTTSDPAARDSAAAWVTADGSLGLYGGTSASGSRDDVWLYTPTTNTWTWIKGASSIGAKPLYGTKGTPAAENTPGARDSAAIGTDVNGEPWLFSGMLGTAQANDLWRMDLPTVQLVRTLAATSVSNTGATLNGLVNPKGLATIARFRYSTRQDMTGAVLTSAVSLGSGSVRTAAQAVVSGLSAGTRYYFQVLCPDAFGQHIGNIMAFTTTGTATAAAAELQFATTSSSVSEGAGFALVEIELPAGATTRFTLPIVLEGTATSAANGDYQAPPLSLNWVVGQTSAKLIIPLKDDNAVEENETVVLSLGLPSNGQNTGTRSTHTITITDNELPLAIGEQPETQFVVMGSTTVFSVIATGSDPITYQWKKNGAAIAGATDSSYSIASTALTAAASYTVDVTNPLGKVSSFPAELYVVDASSEAKQVAAGVSVTFTVDTGGSGLSYQWSKDSTTILGATSKSLTLPSAATVDSGIYTCLVSKTGKGSLQSGQYTLSVTTAKPEITSVTTLTTGMVGAPYTHQILYNTADTSKAPKTFAVTGLPTGLTLNATTGLITGICTTAVTNKVISITATNSAGTSPKVDAQLTILPLPATVLGDWVALADRHPDVADNLGARLDLNFTPTGSYTAKLLFDGATLSGVSTLTVAIDSTPTATAVTSRCLFARTGKPALVANFSLGVSNHTLTGTLHDLATGGTTALNGLHNPWNATSPKATDYRGYYTFGLDLTAADLGDNDVPQGNGFGSFAIGDDGELSCVGRTADDMAFTFASFSGPAGQVVVFAPFAPSVGTMLGRGAITKAFDLANNTFTGSLSWSKGLAPASSTDQAYRLGFPPTVVEIAGGKYKGPTPGGVIMGLPNTANKARLSFAAGGLRAGEAAPQIFTIKNNATTGVFQTVTMPPFNISLSPNPNPNKVTFALKTSPMGQFSGVFTLANPVATLIRTADYQGIIVWNGTNYSAMGYFLLPKLPESGQTVKTSPVLSGQVILDQAP